MLENGIVTGELYLSITDYEPKVLCLCACGCGEEIVEGYEHIFYDGDWFYDVECLLKAIDAEWKVVEIE